MAFLMTGLTALFTGGAAAGGAAAASGAVAAGGAAAAGGLSLSSILTGVATVGGVLASIGRANAEADALNAQAIDAQTDKSIETLEGITRQISLKKDLRDALGAQDVAYAASGVDLSFGTARQARKDAYREADLSMTLAGADTDSKVTRLDERARSYRTAAKRAKSLGLLDALIGGASAYAQG